MFNKHSDFIIKKLYGLMSTHIPIKLRLKT